MKIILATVVFYATLGGVSFGQDAKVSHTDSGQEMLATSGGMTLYVWDQDKPEQKRSNCEDACAQLWPPFLARAGAKPHGDWSLIDRGNGPQQWAYKGRPLYTWAKDKGLGDDDGNGADGNTWHTAKP
jgi:predicted lipoprotein with Yx(FWY)xxD motif